MLGTNGVRGLYAEARRAQSRGFFLKSATSEKLGLDSH